MAFEYEYPRAALAVDCVVFGLDVERSGSAGPRSAAEGRREGSIDLKVLLIQRKLAPFQHAWALPGGFVRLDETIDEAARRELEEEAGVTDVYLEQLYTFGALDRDPRERVVTVAYYALAKLSDHRIRAATDAMGVGWFALDDLPKLAFDHDDIVMRAHERLRGKVRYAPVGFELLPPRFSLTQLQRLYEIILGTELDKRNFRKKILSMDLIVETDEVEQGVRHRAARLYRFDRRKYDRLAKHGFSFAI